REAEPVRRRLGEEPHHRVDLVDAAVHGPQSPYRLRVGAQVLPALDARLVQAGPEVVVPGYPAAPAADQVHDGQVDVLALALELLQRCREVVQGDRAGMGEAERVQHVLQADPAQYVIGLPALDLQEVTAAPDLA